MRVRYNGCMTDGMHNNVQRDIEKDVAEVRFLEREYFDGTQRLGTLLLLTLCMVVYSSFLPRETFAYFVVLVGETLVIPFMFWLMKSGRTAMRLSYLALGIGLLVTIAAMLSPIGDDITLGVFAVVQVAVILCLLVGLTLALFRDLQVSLQTVLGAASFYVLIGILFSRIFFAMDVLAGPFFAPIDRAVLPSDFVYYSFVTLNTIGYGDLTAASEIGRLLSVVEATMGQLYLVIVIALSVGHLGKNFAPHVQEIQANRQQKQADKQARARRGKGHKERERT